MAFAPLTAGTVGGVLFDLDGTLVETGIDFAAMRSRTIEAALRHGARVDDLLTLDVLAAAGEAARRVEQPAALAAEIEQILQEIELEACRQAKPMPGAVELLDWLFHAGIPTAIVTRNCSEASRIALARTGLQEMGAEEESSRTNGRRRLLPLLTRADVPRVKPDPLHLLLAAERLNVTAADVVMVGDHPMDVAAGRAAGMRTVGFAAGGFRREQLEQAGPDLLICHLSELREWLSP